LELPPRSLTLEVTGSDVARRKAKKYIECVMAQRVGDVVIDDDDDYFRDDCTIVIVPGECAGFVTGAHGSFLRSVEEEYGTIMFFVTLKGDEGRGRRSRREEQLAIFGEERGRRGAELKVMAAIENKLEGHLTDRMREVHCDADGFGTDVVKLRMDEMSWALGKKGATRKKLANASGAIVEYVGNFVHMAGDKYERERAREYLGWVMDQLKGECDIDTDHRDDVTVLHIPQDCVGYVTGIRRATLGRIEDELGTFMLFMDKREDAGKKPTAKLAIFGLRRNRRAAELKVMSTVEGKTPGYFTRDTREGEEDGEWGTDTYRFRGEELSYALGAQGTTKKKLARAAHCIIEYVGEFALLSGTLKERSCGMRYLKWLLKQRSGSVRLSELGVSRNKWDDLTQVSVPQETIPDLMGPRGSGLRAIEEDTGTFLFMARDDRSGDDVLIVCGHDATERRRAEYAVQAVVNDVRHGRHRRDNWGGGGDRWGGDSWGGGGRDRWDDGRSMSKYSRGDDGYGYGRDRDYGYGGYGGYGRDYDRDYDRDRHRGYSRDRRRSRSRSYDSYDSRDSRDRRRR